MAPYCFECDGIAYTFNPSATELGYAVSWRCPKCGAQGHYTFDEALEPTAGGRAEARVYSDHHVPVHYLERVPMGDCLPA
jgi:hypothetical protein